MEYSVYELLLILTFNISTPGVSMRKIRFKI